MVVPTADDVKTKRRQPELFVACDDKTTATSWHGSAGHPHQSSITSEKCQRLRALNSSAPPGSLAYDVSVGLEYLRPTLCAAAGQTQGNRSSRQRRAVTTVQLRITRASGKQPHAFRSLPDPAISIHMSPWVDETLVLQGALDRQVMRAWDGYLSCSQCQSLTWRRIVVC